MKLDVNGILLLDKPIQMTSNHALQRVKRLFQAKKAGHTGSLDPIATGMLPICFGDATKFSQFLLDSNKTYYVVAKTGEKTTTGDSEGEVVATSNAIITHEQLQTVLPTFIGTITQVPPMYSAIKHQGKPLYELARRGISVERKPRDVNIFLMTIDNCENQTFALQVHCSKGTYVRTLVEDIAEALQNYAHVIELRRLAVAPYGNAKMYSINELEMIANESGHAGLLNCLLSVETSVQVFPAVKLTTASAFYLRMGQPVRAPFSIAAPLVRLITEDEKFLGLGEVLEDGRVKPHRLLSNQSLQKVI